jgi:hypothetical protein
MCCSLAAYTRLVPTDAGLVAMKSSEDAQLNTDERHLSCTKQPGWDGAGQKQPPCGAVTGSVKCAGACKAVQARMRGHACTALHCTALHCTALHCTALHCTALHCTALHCTVHPSQGGRGGAGRGGDVTISAVCIPPQAIRWLEGPGVNIERSSSSSGGMAPVLT